MKPSPNSTLTKAERALALLAAFRSAIGAGVLTWEHVEQLNLGLSSTEAARCLFGHPVATEKVVQYEFLFENFPELADLPYPQESEVPVSEIASVGSIKPDAVSSSAEQYFAHGHLPESVSRVAIVTDTCEVNGPRVDERLDVAQSLSVDVVQTAPLCLVDKSQLTNGQLDASPEAVQELLPRQWVRQFEIEPPHNAAFDSWPSNPILRDIHSLFRVLAFEAAAHARQQLTEQLGALAERVGASTAALFQCVEGGQLDALIRHNVRKPKLEANIADETGIVAYVAREQIGYCAPDVLQDPLYRCDVPETRSEIAVPIIHPQTPSQNERLLGVVNLESRMVNEFDKAQISGIQAEVGAMVPHLLVLASLSRTDFGWLPWHPEIHGWDLTRIFQKVCHTFAASLGTDQTKCSIWYVDAPKRALSVYATNGYDIEYRNERLLPLSSCTGKFASEPRGEVYSADPLHDFSRRDKAERMGLKTALHCPIYPPEAELANRGISVLNVYFTDAGNDRPFVREAMRALADVIGAMAASFDTQRQQIATAQLRHLLQEMPRSSESDFEVIRDFLRDVFGADGVSIFARHTESSILACTATTGLCDGLDRDSTIDPRAVYYDLRNDNCRGFTTSLALNPGEPLRMNNVLNRREEGLPKFLPEAPALSFVENFAPREDKNRRMLAYGLAGEQGEPSVGVIRILRRSGSKPFTRCDERLIASLASVCRAAFDAWQRAAPAASKRAECFKHARTKSKDAIRAFTRVLRPIPIGRSTRTLIGELAQDLYQCYAGWNTKWCGVFVRHGTPKSECFRLHAYYSEPESTPSLDLMTMPDDDPYLLHRQQFASARDARRSSTPFAIATLMEENVVTSCVRIPMTAWSTQGLIEAVVAVEFKGSCDWNGFPFDPFLYGVSRLEAIWSANNFKENLQNVASIESPTLTIQQTVDRLQSYVADWFQTPADVDWTPVPGNWETMSAERDRELSLYGVKQSPIDGRFAIPLRIGPISAAHLILPCGLFQDVALLRPLLNAVTGIWSQLTFGQARSVGQADLSDFQFRSEEHDRMWVVNGERKYTSVTGSL